MDSSSNLTYTKEDEIKDKKASKETLKFTGLVLNLLGKC